MQARYKYISKPSSNYSLRVHACFPCVLFWSLPCVLGIRKLAGGEAAGRGQGEVGAGDLGLGM